VDDAGVVIDVSSMVLFGDVSVLEVGIIDGSCAPNQFQSIHVAWLLW
jgi:hypothetical protein